MGTLLLIIGLVLFFGLVVVHELGHFFAARLNGVEVEEFGVGFPPRLLHRRMRGGWQLSLNLLPLGGFVKLKGESDRADVAGGFGAARLVAKVQILVAGVTMNLIVAYLLLTVLALVGMPQIVANQFVVKGDATYVQRAERYVAIGEVEPGSPAEAAGIRKNDVLVGVGLAGHVTSLSDANTLIALTTQNAGQVMTLQYRHGVGGTVIQKDVTLRSLSEVELVRKEGRTLGYLGAGVYPMQKGLTVVRSTWSSPIVAAGIIKQFTVLTLEGLGRAVVGIGGIIGGALTGNAQTREAGQAEASSQVAGPVGIFFILKYGSNAGLLFILMIVALLSLTLAIMNILPIPALDGGRLWLMLITRAVKRPLSKEREEAINAAGFAFLMGLIVLVTVVDVRRFF